MLRRFGILLALIALALTSVVNQATLPLADAAHPGETPPPRPEITSTLSPWKLPARNSTTIEQALRLRLELDKQGKHPPAPKPVPSQWSAGQVLWVTETEVNVRRSPGFTKEILIKVGNNTPLISLGKAASADGITWQQVRLAPQQTGWIAAEFLSTSSTISQPLAYPVPPIAASAAVVLDAESGQVLFSYHGDDERAMASTTKIMTGLLAVERGSLGQVVHAGEDAASIGESTMGLVTGERLTLRDMLYGLLLPSGNDAAIAIADAIGGSQDKFIEMMNARAASLGMSHTHYMNPHGLDTNNHFTSAYDLAILAQTAMHNPRFAQVVGTRHYGIHQTKNHLAHDLYNVNFPLYWYPGAVGVKPGYTGNAGIVQVIYSHRDGRSLIAVVMDTPNLTTDVRNLLDWGFNDFHWVSPYNSNIPTYLQDRYPTWRNSYLAVDQRDRYLELTQSNRYYLGSGHYLNGMFLYQFESLGGLSTLGFPQSEIIQEGDTLQQIFSNKRLVYSISQDTISAQPR